jgi:hypothetical protein
MITCVRYSFTDSACQLINAHEQLVEYISPGFVEVPSASKGGRGSDVVMHDIGHVADAALMQHAPTSGGSFAPRIPEWVYTKGRRRKPSLEEKSKWDKYRPDILTDSWDEQKTHKAQRSGCSRNKVLPRYRPDNATEPGREPT